MELLTRARDYVFDVLLVVLTVGVQIDLWSREGEPGRLLVVAALTAPLVLLLRRAYPLLAPLVALVALASAVAADPVVTYDAGTFFLIAVATAWSIGSIADGRKAAAGLLAAIGMSVYVNVRFPDEGVDEYFWVAGMITAVWLVSHALTRRARQAREAEERMRELAAERAEEAQRAVAEERQRIARELHDVVAHSISVMTVQAGGVRRLLREEQAREREALTVIEETGREALAEMRRLLGVLRGANETPALAPQPSLRNVESLLRQVREAGLPVELQVEGDPVDLPPGVDVSAYRIVQEALTNALKYAGPARASVRVDYGSEDVVIEVSNDGLVEAGGDGVGHGVLGMRERVAVCGGSLQVGPRDDGRGFVVRARLPISETVPAA